MILGDSSNRKLSARYCGTVYDADSVCESEGTNIGVAAKGQVSWTVKNQRTVEFEDDIYAMLLLCK